MKAIYWILAQVYALLGWLCFNGGKPDGLAIRMGNRSYLWWRRYYLHGNLTIKAGKG